MSGELEAGGAAITAGLAAAAIEGADRAHSGVSSGVCPNCRTALSAAYCGTCGQPAHIHRTLGHMIEEFVHGVLHFDGRAWRTLPMLFLRPGTLTAAYIHGRRARFISPLALFLFCVFLMFFVFSLTATEAPVGETAQSRARLVAELADADQKLQDAREKVGAVLGAEADAAAGGSVTVLEAARERLSARLAEYDARLAELTQLGSRISTEAAAAIAAGDADKGASLARVAATIDGALSTGIPNPMNLAIESDGAGGYDVSVTGDRSIFDIIRDAHQRGTLDINSGWPTLDKKIKEKLANPELAWYKLQNTTYKFAFLLVPIGLPFVALAFLWKRDVTLFDHSVFLLYSLSFVSLLLVLVVAASRAGGGVGQAAATGLLLAPPAHLFFQLKGGYRLGWFSALWRTSFLLVATLFALTAFLFAILALGFLG